MRARHTSARAVPVLITDLAGRPLQAVGSIALIAMSIFAMISLGTYWLTFFPTRSYISWVDRRASRLIAADEVA